MTIKPMSTEYLAELKRLHDSGIRAARECWNAACEPNWSLASRRPAAFHQAVLAEWDRLSVYRRHQAGCNAYGQPFTVDIETGMRNA